MKYIMIDPYEMTEARWNAVVQKNYSTCRKLSNGKIIIKYTGYHPILFFGYTTYTADEIQEIIDEDSI